MCGFTGWLGGRNPDREISERAISLLRHRGPDDEGYAEGSGWSLAFRRLSIIDLSPLGHQPMFSRDQRFVLVFNGEIYNHAELRQELEQAGERFQGGSDSEVLLTMLARDGVRALSKLNGMFALALIDTRNRTFMLARDRFGVKPLYYTRRGGQLRFASELKALLTSPGGLGSIEPAAIFDYLALGYLPNSASIFADYAKLQPGSVLCGSLDAVADARIEHYWHLTLNDDPASRSITRAESLELEDLLADAVRIRLRSDVPVGIFLSGGIDSGLVAAMTARTSGTQVPALTVGFDDATDDETALARATAQHVGLQHHVIQQLPSELGDVDRLAWFFDEPFGDPSALSMFRLCAAAASHATVFLSGDGGDEAFGGYLRYVKSLRYQRLAAVTSRFGAGLRLAARTCPDLSPARYKLSKLALADNGFAAAFDGMPGDPVLPFVLHPDLRCAAAPGRSLSRQWSQTRQMRSITARQQDLDYAMYLPDDVLTKVDRASMAHSLEVRSPFLDYRLVQWAARLPRGTLLTTRQGKLPIRALAARLLPETVAHGRKRGFVAPLDAWFRTSAGIDLIHDRLLSSSAAQLGFWDVRNVEKVIKLHRFGRGRSFGTLLWRLLMLGAWCRHYHAGSAQSGWAAGLRASDARQKPAGNEPAQLASVQQ